MNPSNNPAEHTATPNGYPPRTAQSPITQAQGPIAQAQEMGQSSMNQPGVQNTG